MNILRVGTDCSGIEAPIQALLQLKIPFRHVFSSDIDKYCIQSIKANYNPEIIFGDKDGAFPEGDITKRNIKDVPDIDLYVCGFPCQSFSICGLKKGFNDKRGNVFFSCFEVIKEKQPKYFILENVKGLVCHNKGNTWKIIQENLNSILDIYNITHKILNTRKYGIPQNRERIFIVGIKKILKKEFKWPREKKLKDIKKFIDESTDHNDVITKTVQHTLDRAPDGSVFVDRGQPNSIYPFADKYTPTLTTQNHLWCIPKSRFATHKERLMLQGFPKNFKQVVSKTQFNKQIGNSMSVNVLKELLKEIL
jgi:DNA (cytosine-5)-methyltransferase 1